MRLLTLRAFFAFSICVLCCQNLAAQGVTVMGPNNVKLQGFGEIDLDTFGLILTCRFPQSNFPTSGIE